MRGKTALNRWLTSIGMGTAAIVAALLVGYHLHRPVQTASLIGTALTLEAQPAAVEAAAMRYPLVAGALVSVLANLAPIPLLTIILDSVVHAWPWARKHVARAHQRVQRYQRWGPVVFVLMSPFIGAYVAIAVGESLGFNPRFTFWTTLGGMLWSVAAIALGGHWLSQLMAG